MAIFDNVKAFADQKGMSIMEIEKSAGLGNGTIGRWRTADPKINSLQAVANVLNVSLTDLLKEETCQE